MSSDTDGGLTDRGKLLFGAGFVFGVMVTMLILAVVLAVVRYGSFATAVSSRLVVVVLAGALFAAIIGTGLYFLAFQRNRTKIPIDPDLFAEFPPAEDDLPPADDTDRAGDDGTDADPSTE